MITISLILSIICAVIVLGLLFQIIGILAAKFGVDPIWIKLIWLVIAIGVVIWAFGLFGISQPIIK